MTQEPKYFKEKIDIYFMFRQTGQDPDKTKYYFKTLDQLLTIPAIGQATNSSNFIQWSLEYLDDLQTNAVLVKECWSTSGKLELKCKAWYISGYIIKEKCPELLHNYLKMPIFNADFRNKEVNGKVEEYCLDWLTQEQIEQLDI